MWLGGAITILKNMSSSMGSIIPYIMENKKCLKPPTSMWVGKTRTLNLADGGSSVSSSWVHRASVLSSAGLLKGVDGKCFNMVKKDLDEHRRGSGSYPGYAASPSIPTYPQTSAAFIPGYPTAPSNRWGSGDCGSVSNLRGGTR
jgi:hypothetical protein